jgi:hypothetical protein
MANWHARQGDEVGNQWEIIYHIPIPNVNNSAGPTPVNFRTALVQAGLNTTVMAEGTAKGQITTAEKNQIIAGAIYEYVERLDSDPNDTGVQLRAKADARYTALVSIIQARLGNMFKYWGSEAS